MLRAYLLESVHFGQQLQPALALPPVHNAAARVTSFIYEIAGTAVPLGSPPQKLRQRTANDYADALAVHIYHLNRVLKAATGRTTTDFIATLLLQKAHVLFRQTNWTVFEIAASLSFTDAAHFPNAFKRQTALPPVAFRENRLRFTRDSLVRTSYWLATRPAYPYTQHHPVGGKLVFSTYESFSKNGAYHGWRLGHWAGAGRALSAGR